MMVRNTNPNHLDNYHVIQRVSNPFNFILGIEQPWIQTPVKQCECGSCGLLDSEEGSVLTSDTFLFKIYTIINMLKFKTLSSIEY